MITLTTVFGKLFNQIVSNHILDYLIANNYIIEAVQKAFINNMNGIIEHNLE